jgi:hypothetical protein
MWFGPPERNTLCPREMLYCCVCGVVQGSVELVRFCRLPDPFIAQGRAATLRPGDRQVAPEWLNSNIVGCYELEVANDVFNDMGYVLSCCPIMLCTVCGMEPSSRVAWHCSDVLRVVNRADVAL